jgi:hypothetical protein
VMLAGPAGERFDQRGPLGPHPAAGQVREHPGAALAGDQRPGSCRGPAWWSSCWPPPTP